MHNLCPNRIMGFFEVISIVFEVRMTWWKSRVIWALLLILHVINDNSELSSLTSQMIHVSRAFRFRIYRCFPSQMFLWTSFSYYIFTYSLAHNPLRALASLITDAHSSLSTAFCHHFLNFISCRSFPTSACPVFCYPPVYSQIFSELSFPDPFLLRFQSIPVSSF
jgi:hypothetical protein